MASLLGGIIILYLVMIAVMIAAFVFWLNMLIEAAKHDFEHKVPWILVIVFGHIIGAILFYFIVYKDKIKPQVVAQRTHTMTS